MMEDTKRSFPYIYQKAKEKIYWWIWEALTLALCHHVKVKQVYTWTGHHFCSHVGQCISNTHHSTTHKWKWLAISWWPISFYFVWRWTASITYFSRKWNRGSLWWTHDPPRLMVKAVQMKINRIAICLFEHHLSYSEIWVGCWIISLILF